MSPRGPAAVLLTASLLAFPSDAVNWVMHPHLPTWVEQWLYNPRERTAAAIDAAKANDPKQADDYAETARRLRPDDPLVHYNAGTARIFAGRKDAAAELEAARKTAGRELTADTAYNLGNARLAAHDAAAAVEAFEQALRTEPGRQDAKYNLELALAERQREKMRAKSPKQGDRGDQGGGKQGSQSPGNDQQANSQQRSGAKDPGKSPQSGQTDQAKSGRPGQASPQNLRQALPGYADQPEMSAAEASAVLHAVENLERQQRREVAAKMTRQRAAQGKDW
jgi:Mg-chelatase subunit ChlI